ncbi:hypothetical protein AB0O07_22985 [Streptomyces sp. NPDC093085]|uniref:hypothetical protein n=1 Tax=Streptomyces sp. NPDC093085 TaxID=3155068 RepID=UPI003426C076
MHADIHFTLHTLRAAELRSEAAEFRPGSRQLPGPRRPRTALRVRLGWSLVELGLRLVNRPVTHPATHLA